MRKKKKKLRKEKEKGNPFHSTPSFWIWFFVYFSLFFFSSFFNFIQLKKFTHLFYFLFFIFYSSFTDSRWFDFILMSDEKPKNRRPANTAFKQQRLKAWQPLLTPKTVLPSLFVLGILFAPFGAFLLYTSSSRTPSGFVFQG
ncbi:hypothetical protein HMI54_005963 [Coelomomyces lativittatus]|nr:hypothetical protein HMI54_005963 [Coelomomyces lativittatus]